MADYNVSRSLEGNIIVQDSAGTVIAASDIKVLVPPVNGETRISLAVEGSAHLNGSVYPHGIS